VLVVYQLQVCVMGVIIKNNMPLPEKKPYERLDQYLQRCIPTELDAGKSRAQAAAICTANFKDS